MQSPPRNSSSLDASGDEITANADIKQEKKQKRKFFSDFVTDPKKSRRGGIAGVIFIGSFAGLAVLVLGSLILNELRAGLTQARADTLRAQGMTIASVLAEAAVGEDDTGLYLDGESARVVLKRLFREPGGRLRLFDKNRQLITDSDVLYDEVSVRELPPLDQKIPDFKKATNDAVEKVRIRAQGSQNDPAIALNDEIAAAIQGNIVAHERFDEEGKRVVSVSIPVQRVNSVVGVLTLESSDVSDIIANERRALIPFIVAAVLANLLSASTLAWVIARPLQQLSNAADAVSSGRSSFITDKELLARPDEIGELAEALSRMTNSLQDKIEANERFAADVAHEIKNPLAAVKNAAELLRGNLKPEQKEKLEKILLSDLGRIDRLVTDISNASRLDAELARENRETRNMRQMIENLVANYQSVAHDKNLKISAVFENDTDLLFANIRYEAIERVLINLLDNAISFSSEGARVRVLAQVKKKKIRIFVEDEGPGIPEEALSRVFERFYTQRPKEMAAFGTHSGLGLAIARQIVQNHNGKLWAQNRKVGDEIKGARFIMELPAANVPKGAA
ncbi:stimulus-sensing domain-containing protein [Pseudaquidulcibacter saccharophilus]|uniref:stimulus-sensing domain-containing protein n=1 Tax=Pseudaquidulcibacter saccharophilus TaxID=2831900 RepID=UPI001EFF2B97|nr:stimulus-sensing domain-containing protein [Pseudaquidulcibacter saccharophilus]